MKADEFLEEFGAGLIARGIRLHDEILLIEEDIFKEHDEVEETGRDTLQLVREALDGVTIKSCPEADLYYEGEGPTTGVLLKFQDGSVIGAFWNWFCDIGDAWAANNLEELLEKIQ